jgi:lipopolysaccharide transport system permease protein
MILHSAGSVGARRNPFVMILAYRRPLWRTTVSEIRQRYAGSTMGLFWVALAPGLLLALYACVFIYIYKTVPDGMDTPTYLVQLFAGLLPFLAFSDGLLNGSGAILSNRAVLLNTVYPAELVALRAVLSGHAVAALGLVLVAVLAMATGHSLRGLVLLPLVLILQVMFVCGVAWPLSLANLVLRDIQQVLTFLCTALMIISPIAFAPDSAPGPIKLLVYLNPLSYFILTCQSLVVHGSLPPAKIVLIMLALSLGAFLLGFRLFQRGKLAFWDYA